MLAEVVDFGDGEGRVLGVNAGSALADVEEAGFVAIGEGAEEDGAHDAEDGGVGSDAESESEGDGEPERGDAGEGADRDPEVTKKSHDGPPLWQVSLGSAFGYVTNGRGPVGHRTSGVGAGRVGAKLGAGSLEPGAGSLELGTWSWELGAWSLERGAWSGRNARA